MGWEMKLDRILDWVKGLGKAADRVFSTRLGWLKAAMHTFEEARTSQAAASVAYYTFFSLFLLVSVSVGS